jgi:hypothetical protein
MAARRGARGSRIAVGGTSEIAGALIAASLQGEGAGAVAPTDGPSFRWTKAIDDPVVVDALASVREIFGIEPDLAVLDVRAVAAAEWTEGRIDALLAAAGTADAGAVEALSRNFASGVVPEVHRPLAAMESAGGVAWIVPYSPFSGGWDATRELVGVARRVWPVAQLRAEDARRFVAGRQVGLSLAHAFLPESAGGIDDDAATTAWRGHLAETFADLVGCAVLRRLGAHEAADLVPQLREARAGMRLADGRLAREDAMLDTAPALRAAGEFDDGAALRNVALVHALPADAFLAPFVLVEPARAAFLEETASVTVCDHDLLPDDLRSIAAAMLAADLEDVVATLPDDPKAMERFVLYGAWRSPIGLQDVFREVADRVRPEATLADAARPESVPSFTLVG